MGRTLPAAAAADVCIRMCGWHARFMCLEIGAMCPADHVVRSARDMPSACTRDTRGWWAPGHWASGLCLCWARWKQPVPLCIAFRHACLHTLFVGVWVCTTTTRRSPNTFVQGCLVLRGRCSGASTAFSTRVLHTLRTQCLISWRCGGRRLACVLLCWLHGCGRGRVDVHCNTARAED